MHLESYYMCIIEEEQAIDVLREQSPLMEGSKKVDARLTKE
jgi:hypothetical protein